jgi:hypothetical protein
VLARDGVEVGKGYTMEDFSGCVRWGFPEEVLETRIQVQMIH